MTLTADSNHREQNDESFGDKGPDSDRLTPVADVAGVLRSPEVVARLEAMAREIGQG